MENMALGRRSVEVGGSAKGFKGWKWGEVGGSAKGRGGGGVVVGKQFSHVCLLWLSG